jgi:hypothetical protein
MFGLGTDHTENTTSNNSAIIACVFIAAGTYLASLYLATSISSGYIIPGFRHMSIMPLKNLRGCNVGITDGIDL